LLNSKRPAPGLSSDDGFVRISGLASCMRGSPSSGGQQGRSPGQPPRAGVQPY